MRTQQQIQNLEAIYAKAKLLLSEGKAKAVRNNDFDTSLGIASREADLDNHLREWKKEVALSNE